MIMVRGAWKVNYRDQRWVDLRSSGQPRAAVPTQG